MQAPRLTELASSGGCAAKYSAARLERLLSSLAPASADDLLIGLSPTDDAAVYRLDDDRAIVFTVDFFPPLVDDPRDFGAIAATNALNDIYAMGGTPLLALSVAAFPETLPEEDVVGVVSGAAEQVLAAGAFLAGGHTIRDEEPKYGLAVVGMVHPDAIWSKAGARPGDALILTKPLGTGLVLSGYSKGLLGESHRQSAVREMTTLNESAASALRPVAPSAVTDVTGFGLLGHAREVADRSGVRIVLEAAALPSIDGALDAARAGYKTAGDSRNREFAPAEISADVRSELVDLAYDPQTAGGLLVAVDADRAAVAVAACRMATGAAVRVGRVEAGTGVALV